MTLGIYDWGSGGLRLCDQLRTACPDLDLIYVGDHGFEDYCELSREALIERVRLLLDRVKAMGVNRVVLANDAASTVVSVVAPPEVVVTGLVEPTLRSMPGRSLMEVGVIGGKRTVLSGSYGRALRKLRFLVVQRVSLDLGMRLETGAFSRRELEDSLTSLLEPLAKADGLLLADSLYATVSASIRKIVPRAVLIDPFDYVLRELTDEFGGLDCGTGRFTAFTTGDPREVSERADRLFGLRLEFSRLTASELAVT